MPEASVIGGGISGLSAAFEFHQAGWDVDVYEASNRWGGKVWSSPVGDRLVDAGPDAILARADAGSELVRELGIEDEMTHPIPPKPAYLHLDGRLHELPSGTVLGIPVDTAALNRIEFVSAEGRRRAALDLELPAPVLTDDLSLGRLCRDRLGDELTDRLIDPLLGGINASDLDRLSLQAAAPLLANAIIEHGSLIRGLGEMYPHLGAVLGGDRAPDQPTDRPPVFFGLTGGIFRIIERLVSVLPARGLHLGHRIESLHELDSDAVVIAVPGGAAAALLSDHPAAAKHLEALAYAGVSQVTVEIPDQPPLDAAGILFPRIGGTVLTASTWLSSKWSHYQQEDAALIRLTSGRFGDDRAARMSDRTLVETLLDELDQAVPIVAEPTAVRVHRWPNALPQYEPGHLDRVAEIRHDLATSLTRVRVAGATLDGIGIPACIASGRTAARQLIG